MLFSFIASTPNSAFLFPGQGSQHIGMSKALVEAYPAAYVAMQEADDTLGFSISQLCFEGPEELLTDTVNAQPAILAASFAVLRAIESELGNFDSSESASASANGVVAGHSMGEYTALVAAGSLTYADGLRLVRRRGELMKQAGERSPGRMAAILGLDEAQVAAVCAEATALGGIAQVANDNCPGQVVISGDIPGMEKAMVALEKAGAKKVVPLAVSIAAHSRLMQPAADELRAAIDTTAIQAPNVPVIANTSGRPITTPAEVRAELTTQLTGSVRWTASIQTALAAGVTRFVEIGPGDVLSGLVKRIERGSQRLSVNQPEGVKALVDVLKGKV